MAARCFPRARPARVPHLLKDCGSIGLPSVTRTATRQKPLSTCFPVRSGSDAEKSVLLPVYSKGCTRTRYPS